MRKFKKLKHNKIKYKYDILCIFLLKDILIN